MSLLRCIRTRPAPALRARTEGFSLLELAVALAVIGVLGLVGNTLVTYLEHSRQQQQEVTSGEVARQALLTFLAREKRLPCPDVSGNGLSGDDTGDCLATMAVGFLPYETLGLNAPPANAPPEQRMLYGVFRAAAEQADLVAPSAPPPTDGSLAHTVPHQALLHTLRRAAGIVGVRTSLPYLTGPYGAQDGGLVPQEDCNLALSNPAYVLVVPGTSHGGSHPKLGGVHTSSLSTGCFADPSRRHDLDYGDSVFADGRLELLGWYYTQQQ